jgi:anthranilate phosphoribosyltransferase
MFGFAGCIYNLMHWFGVGGSMTNGIYDNKLLPFMKGIGVGKSGAKSLTREAADQAMTALLTGKYHPVTFGAFFMGLRYKGETPEELAGFLDAMNRPAERCRPVPLPYLLNCAGAYDGKARTCNVSIPAALVAVAAGVPIALHGARNIPTKHGMTSGHVLEALGIETARSVDEAAKVLESVGITFVEQRALHPGMHALLDMRNQMGKRTILNTMETLSNPFGATNHLGGFFHDPYAELVCRALQTGCTSFRRATMVKGIEGSDELRPGAMFVARLVEGEYATEPVDSDALGLPVHISDLSAPTDSVERRVEFSVQRIRELLDAPRAESSFRNAVLLSAGVRIYASGRAGSIAEGVGLAREAMDGGGAGEVLSKWRGFRAG